MGVPPPLLFLSCLLLFTSPFLLLRQRRWGLQGAKNVRKLMVHDLDAFQQLLVGGTPLQDIQVVGNVTDVNPHHPVVQAVLERWRRDSKPGKRYDTHKIALAIEGGGMRGCVSAGATAALNVLGINDAIDTVYGSSAGAMVGAYFVARQFAGVQVSVCQRPSSVPVRLPHQPLPLHHGRTM